MPNSPTPNMQLVLPAENSDIGVWASLLNTALGVTGLDSHDHSPGRGVKVPTAGLNINADLTMASGGNFFALINAKALDFQAQAGAAVAAYAGALFMNSANNELTWRTAGGTLVQLTNGNSLNASIIGGIGGDYATVGALVDFTDASDSYALRQQVGAAVRQFARLQTADVDLFEFKAQPAAGVPTNRVRLKSPASLAASYDLQMPAALPAAIAELRVNAAGVVSTQTLLDQYAPGFAIPSPGGAASVYTGTQWNFGAGGTLSCPIKMPVGSTFTSWVVRLNKASSAAGTLSATLREVDSTTGSDAAIGATQSNNANAPGIIPLTGAGTTILANRFYRIEVNCTAGGDSLFGWSIQP